MRDRTHRNSVFTPAFLEQFGQRDEPVSGPEAELAGPWKILKAGGSFALLREWDPPPDSGGIIERLRREAT